MQNVSYGIEKMQNFQIMTNLFSAVGRVTARAYAAVK